ncbi:HTH-type transcriptional regulator/antitoxin HigA [Kribbella sp. VKM Ac-2571]|uniref:helix-turn-helix domain-containing protein n=1 Tax=Kribbella sp. VKM Ac-2571 TaxID=2512222 RepID=UPI00105F9622|nr:helix-turn-helix domain-containing protein [Kribbella sp. VKM Ac-2571]TDO58218.1 HTH-type transcriptional regulator/antitoxin HigA [Kribbella sp. VKM Ac-2571]
MTPRTAHSAATPQPLEHDYGVTPGELLRLEIRARGLSQADLAARAGVSAKHLNQVVQDAVPLSADTALRLERALGIPAVILTQADAINQANKQRAKAHAALTEHRTWFAEFPRNVLLQHHIITAGSAIETQIEELLEFFGVAEPKAYDTVYADTVLSFRRAQQWSANPHATSLWLRLAERKADGLDVAPYDKARFSALLTELPTLTVAPLKESFQVLQTRCAGAGVAVVYTPSIEGTRASAAVRWLGPERPLIALTDRGKYEDSLWFSFFHESGHIVLHPRRKSVIELEGADDEDGGETAANNFAKTTILQGRIRQLIKLESREEVVAFAAEVGIHPGLAAAIRAYDVDESAAWRLAAKVRRKLDDSAMR